MTPLTAGLALTPTQKPTSEQTKWTLDFGTAGPGSECESECKKIQHPADVLGRVGQLQHGWCWTAENRGLWGSCGGCKPGKWNYPNCDKSCHNHCETCAQDAFPHPHQAGSSQYACTSCKCFERRFIHQKRYTTVNGGGGQCGPQTWYPNGAASILPMPTEGSANPEGSTPASGFVGSKGTELYALVWVHYNSKAYRVKCRMSKEVMCRQTPNGMKCTSTKRGVCLQVCKCQVGTYLSDARPHDCRGTMCWNNCGQVPYANAFTSQTRALSGHFPERQWCKSQVSMY